MPSFSCQQEAVNAGQPSGYSPLRRIQGLEPESAQIHSPPNNHHACGLRPHPSRRSPHLPPSPPTRIHGQSLSRAGCSQNTPHRKTSSPPHLFRRLRTLHGQTFRYLQRSVHNLRAIQPRRLKNHLPPYKKLLEKDQNRIQLEHIAPVHGSKGGPQVKVRHRTSQ